MSKKRKVIGILGGTFDPIHAGHLRAALEIFEHLSLEEIRLIPCKTPPHRALPLASADDRMHMVKIAIKNSPLSIDEKEMKREGPSYSVDTLIELRSEFPTASLCLIMGVAVFLSLPSWHKWENLLDMANIVVLCQNNEDLLNSGIISDLFKTHLLDPKQNIADFKAGKIMQHKITLLNISASTIRTLIHAGRSPQFLLPNPVWEYIQQHALYGYSKHAVQSQYT